MNRKHFKRLVALVSMVAAMTYAGCSVNYPSTSSSTDLPLITTSGTTDFTKFVVVGNSLTAGYQSGGMAKTFQLNSYGAIIARQLGIDSAGSMGSAFEQPLFEDPGTPGTLTLRVTASGPSPIGVTPGAGPLNLAYAHSYDNMGIPGAFVWDFLHATATANNSSWSQTRFGSQNTIIDPILRGLGTQFQQIKGLHPTFVIWWEGHNDILGYATSGAGIRGNFQAAGVAGYTGVNSADPLHTAFGGYNFNDGYKEALDSLFATGADIITGNIPYVTDIPYFTTIFPSTSIPDTNGHPWYLITNPATGAKTRLYFQEATTPDSIEYLLLPVQSLLGSTSGTIGDLNASTPYGLHPLDPIQGKYTITTAEKANIKAIIDSYNASIATAAAAHNIPVLDVNAIFSSVKAVSGSAGAGYPIGSGIRVKADFISGGLFSLDGVHPSALGYAFIANEFIKKINDHYQSNIPHVNFNSFMNPQ